MSSDILLEIDGGDGLWKDCGCLPVETPRTLKVVCLHASESITVTAILLSTVIPAFFDSIPSASMHTCTRLLSLQLPDCIPSQ
ncbi:hypothetical protein BDR06DRAFT_949955 [Suillus hirtellus]|nr:hypothetical protein BDR06DRAFT_949955 [Suillus hirtellus]